MKQSFQYVLLDVGVVLLHLNYESAIAKALPLCDPSRMDKSQSFFSLLGRTGLVDQYERGELTAQRFYEHFVEQSGFSGSFQDFAGIWRSIFEENTPMLEFGAELATRYPVYFLTNASDLHVPWIFDRFPSLRFFKGWACSCYLGASKPDRAFYDKALKQLSLDPAACLFVDDRPENIAGAESCGIASILYTDFEDTAKQVRKMLNFA